jgi:Fe-Mn family superoxide dismutase
MIHELSPLPYAKEALEPHISAQTVSFHHTKHHQTYVTNLNNLLKDHPLSHASLEEVILKTAGKPEMVGFFNNAAQVWNHKFYWNCMKPNGGGFPSDSFKAKLEGAFGSFEKFCEAFKQASLSQFGSGWAWLVADQDNNLKILKTGNADLPMAHGCVALLTCDVWEHAYYLDYQNRRSDYVDTFLESLINWDFVEAQGKHL